MKDSKGAKLARNWSARLGLAHSPLLDRKRDPGEEHFALLDGIEGSFALSTVGLTERVGLDWTWSSQLTSHVGVSDDVVLVRQVDPQAKAMRFERGAVTEHLDRFLDTIIAKRIAPAISIVDHVVTCFRSHRHVANDVGLTRDEALTSFLALLDGTIKPSSHKGTWERRFPPDHAHRLREELSYNRLVGRTADLSLTMRHAAGMVFQETHAELSTETMQPQLFGLGSMPSVTTRNRFGAYYTPPGLARTLADLVVKQHLDKPELFIFDPACGSGIFLNEVLRSLQRYDYRGHIQLAGIDVSANAIEMARFALKHNDAANSVQIDLEVRDFLTMKEIVAADIILMNPPFVAFQELSAAHQAMLRDILGASYKYRPDFSVLFIEIALRHLKRGGTLASLLPAGVLSQRSASNWRAHIVEASDIDLIAVLGDHGLFRDAMVNVAALMLRKDSSAEPVLPTMLWASQKPGASAAALRRLRRWSDGDRRPERTADWSIYPASRSSVIDFDDWLPRPNTLGDLPERLRIIAGNVPVPKLFDVELGIRSGDRAKFVISQALFQKLPVREKSHFRPIAEKRSIKGGRIQAVNYLFYPEKPMTVESVRQKLPTFARESMAIVNLDSDYVLELARPRRATMNSGEPRIVSRAFIGTHSFAVDPEGGHVVVQGYSWLPRLELRNAPFDILELLQDYCFLLNSRLFFLLMRESGRIVGGGQVDGSKQNLRNVPLPDLAQRYLEDRALKRLADELRAIDSREYPSNALLDQFASSAYQTRLEEWQSTR